MSIENICVFQYVFWGFFFFKFIGRSHQGHLSGQRPFMLFTANNIRSWQKWVMPRKKSSTVHCEKTSKTAQFKDRFSDFLSNFLPFIVLSWSLNNVWDLFLFHCTSSAWKKKKTTPRESFQHFVCVILPTRGNPALPFCLLKPAWQGSVDCC